ncbi:MAG: hypothetical protein FWH27_04595 [Planctomycetaceae bacterium]|nr:hypothetical protein [Planctomycetaceae bacterium]
MFRFLSFSVFVLFCSGMLFANGPGLPTTEAVGNVDGVLNWSLGSIVPNESKLQTVFLVYADSSETARQVLDVAKKNPQNLPVPPSFNGSDAVDAPDQKPVWINNGTTDFALFGPCFFRWDVENRQALRCDRGGQLSQFTWYLNCSDADGTYQAGVPHYEDRQTYENIKVIHPVTVMEPHTLAGTVSTADDKLRMDVVASCGEGAVVQVDFTITNISRTPIDNLILGTYVNFEANHDETNDYAAIDAASAGLMVIDLPTKRTVLLAGPNQPVSGHAGTWNSFSLLRNGTGIPFPDWATFVDFSPEMKESLFLEQALAQGYYLPPTFRNPQTPPLRDLSVAEAEQVLLDDWTRQAQGEPWGDRALAEIAWTRELARRLMENETLPTVTWEEDLTRLEELSRRLLRQSARGSDAEMAKSIYFDVRRVKRNIMFKNPVIDFDSVLMIDQPYQTHREGNHESIHRMGVSATPGGRLLVLEGLSPGGRLCQLAPNPDDANGRLGAAGSFWRPDLSFDAEKTVFCYKLATEKSFKLYEIGLDGTGLRQLTDSEYDDIDPIYLPDGKIMFTTTRGNSYVRCGPFIYSYILAKCDADGDNIYLISYNGEPDFVPSLLNDGRVIYSRWEYSDKPLWRVQSLWTTNQDGTNTSGFWGNQSVWPDHTSQPRAIPGSERIMFVGVGHHDWWSGSVGIIDPYKGGNFPFGLTKVTADKAWPECSQPPLDPVESPNYHSSGVFTGYSSPYPLSEKDFLVSARAEDGKFRLYLMDVDGNRELVYQGVHNIWHAIPIKPRPVPPEHVDRVAWPKNDSDRNAGEQEGGTFYNADVYQGLNGIERGEVKFLRLMQLDYKTYSTWRKTFRHSGPAVSIIQEEGVKRVLSVVPVEPDGSVFFEAPSGVSLYFQLLDEEGRCLHTMRSFSGLMPGENRSCVGCHEMQHSNVPANLSGASLAVKRSPTPLTPPSWGTESIGYERFVQPVLDRYCGECHQKDGEEGKAAMDLTLRPGYHIFQEPYLTLLGSAGWGNPVQNTGQPGYGFADVIPVESMDPTMNDPIALATLPVKQYLSANSRLVQYCADGNHYGVNVDAESLKRIMVWVDACGPYCGEEEIRAMDDPDFEGIELLPIRPLVKTAPVILRP